MRMIDRSLIKESIEELKALQKKVSHRRFVLRIQMLILIPIRYALYKFSTEELLPSNFFSSNKIIPFAYERDIIYYANILNFSPFYNMSLL